MKDGKLKKPIIIIGIIILVKEIYPKKRGEKNGK